MKNHGFKALDYFYSMWFITSGWVLPYLLKKTWFIPEGRTATGREGNGRTTFVSNKQFKIRNYSNKMAASVQKKKTEFLKYLHFSCPFDNFLRCLARATNIAVDKKVLSTTDVHGQCRNQIHTTRKFLPAWCWDWLWPPTPNCQEIIPAGNVFIESGNAKGGMATGSAHPNSREHFLPLCWCSTSSGLAGECFLLQFFKEPEIGKRNPSPTSYSAPAIHRFFCINLHCLCIKNYLNSHFKKLLG